MRQWLAESSKPNHDVLFRPVFWRVLRYYTVLMDEWHCAGLRPIDCERTASVATRTRVAEYCSSYACSSGAIGLRSNSLLPRSDLQPAHNRNNRHDGIAKCNGTTWDVHQARFNRRGEKSIIRHEIHQWIITSWSQTNQLWNLKHFKAPEDDCIIQISGSGEVQFELLRLWR